VVVTKRVSKSALKLVYSILHWPLATGHSQWLSCSCTTHTTESGGYRLYFVLLLYFIINSIMPLPFW